MKLHLPTLLLAGLMAFPAFAQGSTQSTEQWQTQQGMAQGQAQVQMTTTNRWSGVELRRVEADMLTPYERAAARGLPAGISCPSQIEGVYVSAMDTPNGVMLTVTGPERYQDHIRNWARNEGQVFLKQQAMAPRYGAQAVYYPVGSTLPGQQVGDVSTLENGCQVSWRTGVPLEGATLNVAADEGCQVIMPANLAIPPAADIQVMDIDNGARLTFTAKDASQVAQLRQHLRQNADILNSDRCTNLYSTPTQTF